MEKLQISVTDKRTKNLVIRLLTHPSPDPLPTVEERYPEFSQPYIYLGTRGGK